MVAAGSRLPRSILGLVALATLLVLAGASEVPGGQPVDGTWPESDTGLAATGSGGSYQSGSGFAKVGFLVATTGSPGTLEVAAHVTTERLRFTSDASGGHFFANVPPAGWSIADVDGTTGTGCRPCVIPPTPVRSTSWTGVKAAFHR